jgi:hypothetical protein
MSPLRGSHAGNRNRDPSAYALAHLHTQKPAPLRSAEAILFLVDLAAMPGHELIGEGLEDLRAGHTSAAALLVLVGAERLRCSGFDVPKVAVDDPERRLYELLAETDSDSAHSRYNALIRQLVSFERAAECAAR